MVGITNEEAKKNDVSFVILTRHGASKSLLVLRPTTDPRIDNGTTPRKNKLSSTIMVPNGSAAVDSLAQAVEFTKINTITDGTGNISMVKTAAHTQFPLPFESCRYKRLLTYPPINEVPVYNKTTHVETPPLLIGEKTPNNANVSNAIIIVKNCAPIVFERVTNKR